MISDSVGGDGRPVGQIFFASSSWVPRAFICCGSFRLYMVCRVSFSNTFAVYLLFTDTMPRYIGRRSARDIATFARLNKPGLLLTQKTLLPLGACRLSIGPMSISSFL